MRPHRSAAVQIGIDEWRENRWAFKCRVERDAQLAQEGDVRAESGGNHQLICEYVTPAAGGAVAYGSSRQTLVVTMVAVSNSSLAGTWYVASNLRRRLGK